MKSEKVCLECGEPLAGRADKKFCDDQCRSNFNNKANSDVTAEMRNINNILRKNRRIMEAFANKDGKATISRQKLSEKGFNFKYHTHQHLTQKGAIYRLCYDYGYTDREKDFVFIIKWGSLFNE